MELLKLLTTSEIVAQIVSFLVLLFTLKAILWKPFLGALDARKEKIAADLATVEAQKKEAAELKASYEHRLRKADDVARVRIQELMTEAQRSAESIKKKAHEDAQQIMDAARESIRRDISQIKTELKDQVVELTLRATEEIIQEKLTEEQDRRLVEDFLKKMDAVL